MEKVHKIHTEMLLLNYQDPIQTFFIGFLH